MKLLKTSSTLLGLLIALPAQAGWNPFATDWLESAPTPDHTYQFIFEDDSIAEKVITLIKVTDDQKIIYTEIDKPSQQSIACDQLSNVIELNAPKTTRRTLIAAAVSFVVAGLTGGASTVVNGLVLLGGGSGYITRGRSGEEFCALSLTPNEALQHS